MTGLDGSVENVDIKYLDIRWSNICNFKCRSCSSTYSSSWATEDNKQGSNKPVFIFSGGENNDALFDQIKPYLTDIREIYFAGGEPLLTDKHYEVLEYLIAIGNTDVSIRYNTNLSNLSYKNKSIVEYWKHFKNVHVYVSLDSWGERAEYIREGTDWTEIQKNIKTIKSDSPHVKLSVSTVISAFNVSTLIPFLDHVLDLMGNNTEFSFYNLINPHYYSLSILNDEIKTEIIKKLSNTKYNAHIDKQLSNVIVNLHTSVYNEDLKNEFLSVTQHFDTIRKRDFSTTFPELDLIRI
jgi:MoaA/NifB/PqqE/SkfB family radical SAM enzyme